MKQYLKSKKLHYSVASSVCSDLVVLWFGLALTASNPLILTGDIFLAIVSWLLAVMAEGKVKEYD